MYFKDYFNKSELERYKRQLLLTSDYGFNQKRLKDSSVFIAGAGGLGSPAALYLAAAGIGRIRISDYDTIELSNLNRQILYRSSDIGNLKAESARRQLKALNPEIEVEIWTQKLQQDSYDAFSGFDLIIDCLDNIQTRYIINDYSIRSGIPIVHGGINGYAGQISFISPPETACLRCIFPNEVPQEGPIPVIGATAGMIGSMQALEAVKFLTGSGELLKKRLLIIDCFSWETTELVLEKDPECSACGGKRKSRT